MKIIRSWLFSFESSYVRRDFIVSLQVDKRIHFIAIHTNFHYINHL